MAHIWPRLIVQQGLMIRCLGIWNPFPDVFGTFREFQICLSPPVTHPHRPMARCTTPNYKKQIKNKDNDDNDNLVF
jgi:hypothetical protein